MDSEPSSSSSTTPTANRARGRGKSRGGLGKYLRAKGRRGSGRPAEWGNRLVLEGEGEIQDPEELEKIEEMEKKYSKRGLGSNVDRYKEDEPILNSDGEEEQEPEVDLSGFLARQKLLSDEIFPREEVDEEIDHSLDHLSSTMSSNRGPRKGQVQPIAWDKDLEELSHERAIAEANRELKTRFRSIATNQRVVRPSAAMTSNRAKKQAYVEAPPLPVDQKQKGEKEEMQDFLDELLG